MVACRAAAICAAAMGPKAEAWLKREAAKVLVAEGLLELLAKCAKSNFSLPAELPFSVGSRLPLLVSEGLSSLVVGLLGGEFFEAEAAGFATEEKADFSFFALLRTDSW